MTDCGVALSASNSTRAVSVAKLTAARTPSARFNTFSIRAAHAAQVIPVSWRSIVRSVIRYTARQPYPTRRVHSFYVRFYAAQEGHRLTWVNPSPPKPPVSRQESERNATDEHVLEHHPVADEAVERVGERRRTVVLEKEVADPGKAVPCDGRCRQPPRVASRDRGENASEHERRTREMQAAARAVRVLGQVERVELAERLIPLVHRAIP